MNKLKDKTAIITGSTRGIGKAIAIRFAKEGARIVVNGLKSLQEAKNVVKEIEKNGGSATYVMANACTTDGVNEIIKKAIKEYKRIDIAVCSVGKHEECYALETDLEDWDRMIKINLTSTFLMSTRVAKVMKKQKSGKIITISSKMGIVGAGKSSVYCTAKSGVIMLTKTLAIELAQYGILVNGIAPGVTATEPTFARFMEEPKIEERTNKRIPLKRVANPSEIAAAAVFLGSDDSSYVNGSVLVVDGGWIANSDYF